MRRLWAFVLVCAIAAGGSSCSSHPNAARAYAVGEHEETFVDTTRATPTNGSFKGAPTRTLRVKFYYPANGDAPATAPAPFPVVIFSDGWTATPEVYAALLKPLAKARYFVVSRVSAFECGRVGRPSYLPIPVTSRGTVVCA